MIIITTLIVFPNQYEDEDDEVCQGDEYYFPDDTSANTSTPGIQTHTSTIIGGADNGCDLYITTTLTILPKPETPTIRGPDFACKGKIIILEATGAKQNESYSWDDGSTSSTREINSDGESKTYTVKIISKDGCESDEAEHTVFNQSFDAPEVTTEDGRTTICSGESATLIASGPTMDEEGWQWLHGAIGSSTTVRPIETTTYKVYYVAPNGCESQNASITIEVIEPYQTPTITGNPIECLENTTMLTADGDKPNDGSYYSWSTNATGTTTNASIDDSPVTVWITDGACPDSDVSDDFDIEQEKSPGEITVTASPDRVCKERDDNSPSGYLLDPQVITISYTADCYTFITEAYLDDSPINPAGDSKTVDSPLNSRNYYVTVYADNESHQGSASVYVEDGCPLPVELVEFIGTSTHEGVLLNWRTASELNNDRYEIMRSLDGKTFELIETVTGNGTSNIPHSYQFLDRSVLSGIYYYRLRQVDYDGQFSLSKIISVDASNTMVFNVGVFVPNPTQNNSSVIIHSSQEMELRFLLFSIEGKHILTKSYQIIKGGNKIDISLNDVPSGAYVGSFQTNSSQPINRKLIIQE